MPRLPTNLKAFTPIYNGYGHIHPQRLSYEVITVVKLVGMLHEKYVAIFGSNVRVIRSTLANGTITAYIAYSFYVVSFS